MSIVSDLGKSVTGNVETALLVIHDFRSANQSQEFAGKTNKEKKTAFLADIVSQTEKALAGQKATGSISADKSLKVQFNPSQLTVNASALPKHKKDNTSAQARAMAVEDAKLILTVKLVFDDMDTYDAFMWEKFTAGLTATGIANALKPGKEKAGKNPIRTVQWQVESLISALRNPYTRTISFRWSDFCFSGQLNAVQANYTMFSSTGRPIRAEVLLRIQHEMSPDVLKHWYDNFRTAFKGDQSKLVKQEQNYSALLNLNL